MKKDSKEHPKEQPQEKPEAKKRGRGYGVPFTSETGRKAQLSSAQAKTRRREARLNMLNKLTTELDLGAEMVKAFKAHDDAQMALIERALKIVGLCHDQAPEEKAQHLNIRSENKNDTTVHVKVTGLEEGTGN